jgi:2-keto-4-pentenoate hydratase
VNQVSGASAEGVLSIAERFVAARLAATPLAAYPGTIPPDMDSAYRCQDEAIALWPDEVVGWKVGWIGEEQQRIYREERIVGPIFRRGVRIIRLDEEVEFTVYRGGFAAVEAEYVFRLASDAPADKVAWTDGEAESLVAALHIGVEPASSPLATINELGPAVVASDFGNNAGLLLGPEVGDWRRRLEEGMTCETFIEGRSVGKGGTNRLPKGPLGALAFALTRCARRGRPLRAGCLISTGAASGIHDILTGQRSALVFDGIGTLRCRAVAATPSGRARTGARSTPT